VRRLTATEIRNSARDLFLGGRAVAQEFPNEQARHKFETHYEGLGFPEAFAEAVAGHAERVAAEAVKGLPSLLPCSANVTSANERACATTFVERHGPRVYRRPLTAGERERLLGVFGAVRAEEPFSEAIGAVIEAMLQAPGFLFRTELGDPVQAGAKMLSLTPHEVAAALSYFVWGSTPDDRLLAAAAAGKLGSRAEIEAEARRMLEDPRAKATLRSFVRQWLEIQGPASLSRDPSAFPTFGPRLAASLDAEADRFFDEALSGPDAWRALFSSSRTALDAELAKIYELPAPAGATPQAVSLDPMRRAGFLTLPSFLASHTPPSTFSPVFLGAFVRRNLLCQAISEPPADVPPLPATMAVKTTRERFARHSSDAACAGCHRLMDPIGFGFERYDGLGRYAETERGTVPLTGAGELTGTDVDGPFVGAVALGAKLAASDVVKDCFAGQLFQFALGRDLAAQSDRSPADARAVAEALARFRGKGADPRELVIAAASSDIFTLRDASAVPTGR
jgi:hypothetical protein